VTDVESEPNTGLLLYIPYRWLENRVIAALAEAGYDDITVAQMKIVQRIGPDGSRLTQLAEQAQVTKQTAGFLVDQLEKANWVERVPDPSDKRARLVRIAARGKEALPIAAAAVAEAEAIWETHLGTGRMTELRSSLNELRRITDPS
jgi:DNA-binding MarR family transcriptional regulator